MSVDPVIAQGYGPGSNTGTVMRHGYVTVGEIITVARGQIGDFVRPVTVSISEISASFMATADLAVPYDSWIILRSSLLVQNIRDASIVANQYLLQALELPIISDVSHVLELTQNILSDVQVAIDDVVNTISDIRVPIITSNRIRSSIIYRASNVYSVLGNAYVGVLTRGTVISNTLVSKILDVSFNIGTMIKQSQDYTVKGIKDMTRFIMEFILDDDDEGSNV